MPYTLLSHCTEKIKVRKAISDFRVAGFYKVNPNVLFIQCRGKFHLAGMGKKSNFHIKHRTNPTSAKYFAKTLSRHFCIYIFCKKNRLFKRIFSIIIKIRWKVAKLHYQNQDLLWSINRQYSSLKIFVKICPLNL